MSHKTAIQIITESLHENPEITISMLHPVIFGLLKEETFEDDMEPGDDTLPEDEIDADEEAIIDAEIDPSPELPTDGDGEIIDPDIDLNAPEVPLPVTLESPELVPVQEAIDEFFSTFDSIDLESTAGKRFLIMLKGVPSGAPAMIHWLEKYYRLIVPLTPLP